MSVLDDIAAIKPAYRTFAEWLATDPPEADGVLDAMRDNTIPVDPIVRALRKNSIPCTSETVKAYRGAL